MKKIFFLLTVLLCISANAQEQRLRAPKNLKYISPNTFVVGTQITPRYPTAWGGAIESFSVSPSLPAGLVLNATSGKISGTPTVVSSMTGYTVTATNDAGSSSFVIKIKVNAATTVLAPPSGLSYTSPNTFTVGTAISTLTPTVSGGAVASYNVAPSLPGGLAISSSTGKITGTPTVSSLLATYTVTATNASGSTSYGVQIKVNAAPVALAPPSSLSYTTPNTFTAGTAITTLNPTVSGGAIASYSVSPSLPSGLSLSSSTGKISGTPASASSLTTYTVTATNASGSTSFGVQIKVNSAPIVLAPPSSLSYPTPNTFTAGTAITALNPTVSGGAVASYSVSPSLPSGLALSSSTGKITGTPSIASSLTTYTVTATNASGNTTFGVQIKVNAAPIVLPAPSSLSYTSPNTFVTGTSIAGLTPSISGGAVASYSVSPGLPQGLSLNSTSGVISGTPTSASGSSTYTVTATNATGSTSFGVVITVNTPPVNPPSSPTTAVTYTTTSASIANPERGFYKHTETHSTGYSALNQSTLTGYRTNSNINLILRVFYLEDFVNSSISSSYLSSMQSDFVKLRAAGLKCIARFAYSDDNDNGAPQDATKAMILSHINQLAPILQANSDVIAVMQVGFIGAWGEWYYTDHFGMDPTPTDYANRKEVVNALLAALPAGKMVQMRTPALKQNTYNVTSPLSLTQAYTSTNVARVGHHNDCFLASSDDYGTYNNPATEYPYLEQETKYVPMGGETCAVNVPRSQCATALSEMAKFHWSYMNLDYHESVIAGFQSNNCFSEIQNRMGYRFELVDGVYPTASVAGASMPVTIKIKNVGFATPFNARVPYIVLRHSVTNNEYKIALNSNPRFWNAGTTVTINDNIALPSNVVPGTYKLFMVLPDSDPTLSTRPEYSIRMANNNTWESTTGYNNLLHNVNITSGTSRIAEGGKITEEITPTMYPVPTDEALVVEMESISSYEVGVFNSLGQKMAVSSVKDSDNKITLNTQNLINGVYFVSFANGDKIESKKIIVSH